MRMLPLGDIVRREDQPRKTFDPETLQELADSISQLGVLQPLVVRPLGDKFEIVAGERRFRAAEMAGLTELPVMLVDMSSDDAFVLSVAENVNREDMNPVEEANAYQVLVDQGRTTTDVADLFGKTEMAIQKRVDLLNLDGPLLQMTETEQLGVETAWFLSRLSVNGQYEVMRKMNTGELATEYDARRYANAVQLRESESPLFDFGAENEEEVERAAEVKTKVSGWVQMAEKAAAGLDRLNDLSLEDLASLGSDVEVLRIKLEMLRTQASRLRSRVVQAEAIVKAAA